MSTSQTYGLSRQINLFYIIAYPILISQMVISYKLILETASTRKYREQGHLNGLWSPLGVLFLPRPEVAFRFTTKIYGDHKSSAVYQQSAFCPSPYPSNDSRRNRPGLKGTTVSPRISLLGAYLFYAFWEGDI